jgi:hypothetical protein
MNIQDRLISFLKANMEVFASFMKELGYLSIILITVGLCIRMNQRTWGRKMPLRGHGK